MAWESNGGKIAVDSALRADLAADNANAAATEAATMAFAAEEATQSASYETGLATAATIAAKVETDYIKGKRPLIEQSIADAATAKTTSETVQGQFNQVVADAGGNNPEVVQARGGEVNLNVRLDKTAQQLAETVKLDDTGVLGLNVFDESTRNMLQGQEPGTINAVLGDGNVTLSNLEVNLRNDVMDLISNIDSVDVPVTNMLANAGFLNNKTGWSLSGANTYIISDSPDSASGKEVGVNQSGSTVYLYQEFDIPKGHKLYLSADVTRVDGGGLVGIVHANKGEFASRYYLYSASNEVYRSIRVVDKGFRFGIQTSFGGSSIFRNLLLIDLTEAFGAGNEPTVEEMSMLLEQFPKSWFDGTKNLFNARHFMIKYLKEIQELRNAITALGGNS